MPGDYTTPGFYVSTPPARAQNVPNSATSTPGGPVQSSSTPSAAQAAPTAPDPSTQGTPTPAAPAATDVGVVGGNDQSTFTPQAVTGPPGAQAQTTISATPAVQAQQAGGARQQWQGSANSWNQTPTQSGSPHWPEWDDAYGKFQQGQPQQPQAMPTFMSPITQAQPPAPVPAPVAAPPTYVPPKNNSSSGPSYTFNV